MGATIVATELSFVALMILGLALIWPDPPLRENIVGAVAYNILFPRFLHPFSKTILMGFDWAFNPPDWTDIH